MRKKFEKLPQALQKQILFRSGGSVLLWLIALAVLVNFRDVYLFLPCLLCAGCLTIESIRMACHIAEGRYIHLQGECIQMDRTGLRRKISSLYLALEAGVVKVPVRKRIRNIEKGIIVSVYVACDIPVYEKDGVYIVNSYYAMEITKRQ